MKNKTLVKGLESIAIAVKIGFLTALVLGSLVLPHVAAKRSRILTFITMSWLMALRL